jgi:hypothetical protein
MYCVVMNAGTVSPASSLGSKRAKSMEQSAGGLCLLMKREEILEKMS